MDPNTTLADIRESAEVFLSGANDERAVALAEAVIALDEWLTKGGFLPADWSR